MLSLLRIKYLQFLEHAREKGCFSALAYTFYKYEEAVPVEKDLATLKPLPESSETDLRLLELGPENFAGHSLVYPLPSRRERVERYFDRGYRALAMVRGNEVVADLWYVTRQNARTREIHPNVRCFRIDLGPDMAYMFDMHFLPGQRGGGAATYFMGSALHHLRGRGITRAYGYFSAHNTPALWVHRLLGWRELPRFELRRFFLYENARLKTERQSQPGKRAFDLLLCLASCPLWLPLVALVALVVRIVLGAPVLFRQDRPGMLEKPMRLLKFRTMTDARDAAGNLLPDGVRLTPLGRFLRRSSLDELPELFNVIRGDLSLVGPRPLLTRYLPFYSERERRRHSVRPGLTGWAQINGRNHLPWDERLSLDIWYVENWSLSLDARILVATVGKVLRREGVAADTDTVETDLDQERQSKWSQQTSGLPPVLGRRC